MQSPACRSGVFRSTILESKSGAHQELFMAPFPEPATTSCFAASVALLAPGLARQWSESESHPNEPQALTQFLVLSHIVALLSSG